MDDRGKGIEGCSKRGRSVGKVVEGNQLDRELNSLRGDEGRRWTKKKEVQKREQVSQLVLEQSPRRSLDGVMLEVGNTVQQTLYVKEAAAPWRHGEEEEETTRGI